MKIACLLSHMGNAVKLCLKHHPSFRCVAPYRMALKFFFYKYHSAPHLYEQCKAAELRNSCRNWIIRIFVGAAHRNITSKSLIKNFIIYCEANFKVFFCSMTNTKGASFLKIIDLFPRFYRPIFPMGKI